MDKETVGIVISIKKQWWLKINTKPFRTHALDGTIFPHIITVKYAVDGKEYKKKKWIRAGQPVPELNTNVCVFYDENKLKKCKIIDTKI